MHNNLDIKSDYTVTVILAVYNEERRIESAINSIVQQTYVRWKMIIVDDGSSDQSSNIVSRLISKTSNKDKITLLVNDDNCGLAYSLNRAISQADTEYIARMDADDISVPSRLEKQVNYLNMHSDVDVVGAAAFVRQEGLADKVVTKPESHIDIRSSIEKINPFFHSSVMMRKKFIVDIGGYDESLFRAQDYDLWLRGVDISNYYNLQEPLLYYASKPQSFRSIVYGLRVRVINAFRRKNIVSGVIMAFLVFVYGVATRKIRTI